MTSSQGPALLSSSPEGATAYIDADLRATATIAERAAGVLDFGQPFDDERALDAVATIWQKAVYWRAEPG
jgi:hypothetical protein